MPRESLDESGKDAPCGLPSPHQLECGTVLQSCGFTFRRSKAAESDDTIVFSGLAYLASRTPAASIASRQLRNTRRIAKA